LQVSSHWSTFPARTPGVRIELKCDAGLDRFVISSVYLQILICQPPVTTVKVGYVGCCCRDKRQLLRSYYDKVITLDLDVETGVTIGDVYNAAANVVKEHRFCPLAPIEMMDDEGIVQPNVGFIGFGEGTNGLEGWRLEPDAYRGSARREGRSAKDKSHLQAYSTAKMLAAHNEIAIPTMAVYDEKRIYYESLPRPYWLDGLDGELLATRNLRDPV
jgi:hypothetical protein